MLYRRFTGRTTYLTITILSLNTFSRSQKINGSAVAATLIDSDGFEPCDEFGAEVPAELGPWDGALYVCTRCWRVINGNTLEILRDVEEAVIEKNMEYRWPSL